MDYSTPTASGMEIRQTRPHFSDLFLTWFGESGLNVARVSCCSLTGEGRVGGGGGHPVWSISWRRSPLNSLEILHASLINCGGVLKSQQIPFLLA